MKHLQKIIPMLLVTQLILLEKPSICMADFGIDITASVTANATRSEDSDPFSPILDNFNDGGVSNIWGGVTGTFTKLGSTATCVTSNYSTAPYEGAFSLKIDYNVSEGNSYAGYFSNLMNKDLSAYKTISFYVKGASGGEYFKVEFKNNSADANRNHAAVYITDYLDGGVTTAWKQVTIPLHNFANISDWTSMKEFVITFENSQSVTNGSPTQGTIYIDNISFSTTSANIVRIDHYGDKIGTCALGGNMGDMGGLGGTAAHSFTTVYHNYAYGLSSQYNVTSGWAGQFIMFGGGNDGWTAIPHNFSEYNYVSLYIRAESVSKNPKVLKVEFTDSGGNKSSQISGITESWQNFKIPLTAFTALDKTTIKQISLVYEDWRIQAAGGNKVGTLYIDEVQFEK